MKAVILAGGEGTRLRPLTYSIPKPLLPIGRKPILEIIMELLREHGFWDIILTVEYKAELIKSYFRDGSNLGVNITYFQEGRFLGTAGPVKAVEDFLGDEPFITMNGDLLTDLNFSEMYSEHLNKVADLTMATTFYNVKLPFGVVDTIGDDIVSIREKPILDFMVNAGIYIISPYVLDFIPKDKYYDMPDLIQSLIDHGRRVETYQIDGKWQDLGTMESYEEANAVYLEND